MALLTDLTSLVRAHFPDGADRFSDADIRTMAYASDCIIRPRGEMTWGSTDLSLQGGVIYYPIPSDAVRIRSVQYSLDGTNFDDGVLYPLSYSDLDSYARFWVDVTGTPEYFGLLGTPGVSDKCYLIVWRPLATASGQKIRVNYTKCYTEKSGSDWASEDTPSWIVEAAYLPHVLSQIYAREDKDKFKRYWGEYLEGVRRVRGHFVDRYGETLGPMRTKGPGIGGRQL